MASMSWCRDATAIQINGYGDLMSDFDLNRREVLAGLSSVGDALMIDTPPAFAGKPSMLPKKLPLPQAGPGVVTAVQTADILLTINGDEHSLSKLDVNTTLLDCLRDDLRLTGSKKGCGLGHCGACTVLIDGRRVTSCLTLAIMQQGKQITTIEGLANGDDLHPMQSAFIEHDAYQCGYCTPGQIMSAVACIHEGHAGSDDEIREWMSGNICRCGAYPNIVAAIRSVAQRTA